MDNAMQFVVMKECHLKCLFHVIFFSLWNTYSRLSSVKAGMLGSSAIDHGLDLWVKPNFLKLVFVEHAAWRINLLRANTSWQRIKIMCQSGATCLPTKIGRSGCPFQYLMIYILLFPGDYYLGRFVMMPCFCNDLQLIS